MLAGLLHTNPVLKIKTGVGQMWENPNRCHSATAVTLA